ncbi:MAG: DUF2341 domain-containing protein, partial [Terrimicrobiaceae bacterium]|nr:DUF2341 domain-containing protein [Terrimicrobiaceae bacterium]
MRHWLPIILAGLLASAAHGGKPGDWWDKAWTGRKSFTIETGKDGADISDSISNAVVLLRLHQGNFPFEQVREDGADVRAVSADGSQEFPLQIEKIDPLMYEAFAWVRLPEIKGNSQTAFSLYFGNPEPPAREQTSIFDDQTVLVYHFAEKSGSPPKDSSPAGNNAETGGTASEGSLIGGGLRLLGADPISIPSSETLNWNQGQDFS